MQLLATFRSARRDPSLVVLEGFHAVKHAVRFGAEFVSVVAVGRAPRWRRTPRGWRRTWRRGWWRSSRRFRRRCSGSSFLGLRIPGSSRSLGGRRGSRCASGAPAVLLEEPQDLGNVGACVRVAAAAGAGGVVVTGDGIRGRRRRSGGRRGCTSLCRSCTATPPDGRPVVAFDPERRAVRSRGARRTRRCSPSGPSGTG